MPAYFSAHRSCFFKARQGVVAMVVLAAVALPGGGAFAQASDMQILLDRISRLERDIRTLNQQIARGPSSPFVVERSPGGGATPLQTAPQTPEAQTPGTPLPGGVPGESGLSRVTVRISSLEQEIRQATGASESLSYRVDQISARLDSLISDLDYRLARLERGALNGSGGEPSISTVGKPDPVSRAGSMPTIPGGTTGGTVGKNGTYVPPASGTRALGSISQKSLDQFNAPVTGMDQDAVKTSPQTALAPPAMQTPAAPPAMQTPAAPPAMQTPAAPPSPVALPAEPTVVSVLPEGTPRERYQFAFGLMRQARYDEAEVALKEFIAQHGDDPLANNARYWLGETFYVRKSFMDAAQTFFEAYNSAPAGAKAADSLLKLGMAMANLEKTEEACATFGKLRSEFSDLKPAIQQNLERQTKRLKCP